MHHPVRNILQSKGFQTYTIDRYATVAEAVAAMNSHRVGALVVVRDHKPVGLFTERDILVRVVSEQRDPRTTWVDEVMTDSLVTVTPNTSIEEAMKIMTEWRCRHLPVIDDGELIGVISIGDLIRWTLDDKEHQIDDLVRYIHGR